MSDKPVTVSRPAPSLNPLPGRRSRVWMIAAVASVMLLVSSGCRAIGRFGDSRQAIAARTLSRQGIVAMHDGNWPVAEQLFTNALEVSASDDRAHWGLAQSLWQRGDHDDAIAHMERAVKLSAGDPVLLSRLGRMYLEVGRVEEAAKQSLLALDADRHASESWTLRGDCLTAGGLYEKALAAYHRALALDPDCRAAQMQAAEIYHRQGRYDRLLATLDRLADQQEGAQPLGRIDLLRGIAMRKLGRPDEAQRCFAIACEKLPQDSDVHLQIASLALESGDIATARTALSTAIRLDPSLAEDAERMNEFRYATTPPVSAAKQLR